MSKRKNPIKLNKQQRTHQKAHRSYYAQMCNCIRPWYQTKSESSKETFTTSALYCPTNYTSLPTSPPVSRLTLYCCAHSNSFHWHTIRVLVYWIRLGV